MDNELLRQFASNLEVDPSVIQDRWEGSPDKLAEDLFRVPDMDTGKLSDLELFDVQRKVIHAYFYGDCDTLNLYKGRRIGYSFIVCLAFLLEGMFKPNSNYAFVSRTKGQADERISDIKTFINNAKVDIPTEKQNVGKVTLWNGTTFQSFSGDPDAARGLDSARAVMLDEMAFIEDQKAVQRAFGAFLALGEDRTMVQVSTPDTENDKFMETHNRGSPTGYVDADGNPVPPDHPDAERTGVLSIRQPTFYNDTEIDVETPLHKQELKPVRPDINISQVEDERASDPEGFGQEYLCRPVVNEYRFFSKESVIRAQDRSTERGYPTGMNVEKHADKRVMGVDIGISHDDTVIQVVDHRGQSRLHRLQMVVDKDLLRKHGIARNTTETPDPANANHVAELINKVYNRMDVDVVLLDRTGPGETFDRIITEKIGRAARGFNFSDKEAVNEMMGDMNVGLRQNRVTVLNDDRLRDELCSVVKQKKEDWSKPKFSGKDNSASGKDDTAMALAMACYPPGYSEHNGTAPSQKEQEPAAAEFESSPDPSPSLPSQTQQDAGTGAFSAANVTRSTNSSRRYNRRHTR